MSRECEKAQNVVSYWNHNKIVGSFSTNYLDSKYKNIDKKLPLSLAKKHYLLSSVLKFNERQ